MSISIAIDIPKTAYIGGERVEGNLIVKVPANAPGAVRIPGIVINAGSRTRLTRGTDTDDVNKGNSANTAEPYTQQLRVVMPRGGETELSFMPGSSNTYPFGLILPPDLLPSYYCATLCGEDGVCQVASLSYQLTAAVASASNVTVKTEAKEIQVIPVALPYGPQPRKGYVIPVFHRPAEGGAAGDKTAPKSSAQKHEKASAGCMGGGADRKESAVTPKGQATPQRDSGEWQTAGSVKMSITMQSAYVCLIPNVARDENARSKDSQKDSQNTMWVEVRLVNNMTADSLPFQLHVSLKLVTTYTPQNGEDAVENVVVLASRTAKAVLPSISPDDTLELKPGEATPMRISLTVPQQLALAPCATHKMSKVDAESRARPPHKTEVPVPPTVETETFHARTVLEVQVMSLDGRTKNDEHIVVLEDPVEIVGVPEFE